MKKIPKFGRRSNSSEEEDGEEDPELDAAVGPEVPLQYVLYSKVPELQRALVYSRALYNLESTAKLEEEAAAAHSLPF